MSSGVIFIICLFDQRFIFLPQNFKKVPKTSIGGPLQGDLRAMVLIKHLTPSGELSAPDYFYYGMFNCDRDAPTVEMIKSRIIAGNAIMRLHIPRYPEKMKMNTIL